MCICLGYKHIQYGWLSIINGLMSNFVLRISHLKTRRKTRNCIQCIYAFFAIWGIWPLMIAWFLMWSPIMKNRHIFYVTLLCFLSHAHACIHIVHIKIGFVENPILWNNMSTEKKVQFSCITLKIAKAVSI